ncbi:MAG: TlpA disulfide reductase family protein, partial [SAR324 cluster bacterium]|nr:TlpA disulfide reductase family protein [SAR324 cluster bacterium]
MRLSLILLFLFSPFSVLALSVGEAMPDISGHFTQINNSQGAIKPTLLGQQRKNKPMVVAFFSVTCIPCIREAPDLEELRAKFASNQVTFLYVSLDPPGSESKLKTFVKKTKTEIPIFFADVEKVKKIYEAYGMPKLILVDNKKNITKIYEG